MKLPSEQQVDQLMRIYQTAEAHLSKMVEQAVQSGQLGTAAYRRQQLSAIQGLLTQLQAATVPEAVAILRVSYQEGLTIASLAGVDGPFAGVHTEAVNVLADSLTSRLQQGIATVGRQVEDVFRKEGLRLSAISLAEGNARTEASDAMVDALKQQGITAFEDRAGRDWSLETYTRMVMRTTPREATSEGTRNRLIEGGLDLVEWVAASDCCDQCQEFAGNVYSLTGATPGYEVLEELPPLHPNDICVIVPSTVTFDALEAALA